MEKVGVFISYPITQFPNYPITQLPSYPLTQLPNYPVPQLPNYPITQVPNYPITQLPNYPITQTSFTITQRFTEKAQSFTEAFMGLGRVNRHGTFLAKDYIERESI